MLQFQPFGFRPWWAFALLLCGVAAATPVEAQTGVLGSNRIPSASYYLMLPDFYDGNYREVSRDFTNARGAIRFGTDMYLDSVCYWTMAGECNYLTGNYPAAVELYESALTLYLKFAAGGWQQRIQPLQPMNAVVNPFQAAQINWGQSTRTFTIPALPDGFQVLFGRLDNERVAQQGGVIQNPEFRQVDVTEIMRCTALSLHRRRMLKGVTSRLDPFSTRCLEVLEPLEHGDGSLLGAWNGIALGIALASLEDFDKAQQVLVRSLQFNGGMDHPLTPVGLLELAIIKYQLGDLSEAANYALEASYSAAIYRQYDLVDEALSLGSTIHLAQQRTPYPPLVNAISWLGRERARFAQTSLTIRLAECYSEAGDSVSSARLLAEVSRVAGRLSSTLAGRLGYLVALNLFLEGNFDAGRLQLAEAMTLFQSSSRWLYQLGLADTLTLSKKISDRQSDLLYGLLLRDPLDSEWQTEPIEAMSFLTSNHLGPMERWFTIAITNRDFEHAIEIAELLRRHRFFAMLPLAGRQLAFRWLMHAPQESVSEAVINRRTDFLTRFPAYKQLCDRADQLQQQLLALPMLTDPDTDQRKEQMAAFVELMKISQAQEAGLGSFALRREAASMSFPPVISATSMRSEIQANQLVIYTVAAGETVYFFAIDIQGAKLLSFQPLKKVAGEINQLMKDANLSERGFDPKLIAEQNWQETAYKVGANWLPQLDLSPLGEESEIIIIPDGILWYVPFELLRFGAAPDTAQSLFDLGAIRYSPTLALALQAQRPYKQWSRTAVFSGPLSNRFEAEWTAAQVTDYQKVSPSIVNISERLDIPTNLFNTVLDQVVVWTESARVEKSGPFGVVPAEKDRGKNGSNLAGWMSLPYAGAEHVVLPCFAGAADNGVRGNADGHEFFVVACAMLSSGTRTMLISRWNVGGESVLKATRKYLDDVAADYAPSRAWHRAAQSLQQTPLDWNRETRLKPMNTPPELTGAHPVFWSGYMLLDVPTKHTYRNGREEAEAGPLPENAPPPGDAPAGKKQDAPGAPEPGVPPGDKLPGEGDGQPAADEAEEMLPDAGAPEAPSEKGKQQPEANAPPSPVKPSEPPAAPPGKKGGGEKSGGKKGGGG